MKRKMISLIAITVLAIFAFACNASFTTANISSFNFGKNETATPPTTTFDAGEKIFAVANISNSMSKMKVKFKLTAENVQGKTKGESLGTRDFEMASSGSANFFFNTPMPGDYKVEVSLVDEAGKEVDKKSGTVTVKGTAPASTETKKDDSSKDPDHDSDDKPKDH